MRSFKAVLAPALCVVLAAGPIESATTAVSMSLSSFCVMAVTSNLVSLIVSNPGTPGKVPDNPVNGSTYLQYSSTVASGVSRRITAAWSTGNSAPTGCFLLLTAAPGSGQGSSAGQITVSATAQNILTGIKGCATGTSATSGVQLSYLLSIAAMTSLVANENKTAVITFTLTDS